MAGGVGRHSIVSGLEDSCFVWENWWRGGAVGATILGLSDGGKGFLAPARSCRALERLPCPYGIASLLWILR